MKLQRCKDCGDVITDDDDFREGKDDPERCEFCNDDAADLRS